MQSSKVLLLESVAAQVAAARNALVGAGCRLLISRLESDGLERAREWKPDVVILSVAYVKENLPEFCRLLRNRIEHPFHLVVAASGTRERFFDGAPEVWPLVDGFVQLPYTPSKLREALEEIPSGKGDARADETFTAEGLEGKSVLLLDPDPEVGEKLRERLEPEGVEVAAVRWEQAAAHRSVNPAQAIVLGWPLPEGFSVETLKRIKGGEGENLPVILLSSSGQDVVQARSPALLKMSRMLFIKPVPWKHFFRFFLRLLQRAPAPGRKRILLPPSSPNEEMRSHFQQQMETKFLEVEELKGRLQAAESLAGRHGFDAGELKRLKHENEELQEKARELTKRVAVDLAKHQLRETELEVRLASLIRKKTEAERRAQDLIDASTERADEVTRGLEEAHGELQMRLEEAAALRADLEQTLVLKESLEEKLQASSLEAGRERESLEAEKKAAREEAEMSKTALAASQGQERELLRASEESRERESLLERELTALKEKCAAEGEKTAALVEELEKVRASVSEEAGKAEKRKLEADRIPDLEKELEGRRQESSGLQERLKGQDAVVEDLRGKLHSSEIAVAGLDEELSTWRHRSAEAEALIADLAAREAKLARELEEREDTPAPAAPVEDEILELVEEQERALKGLEEKLGGAENARSALERRSEEKERALRELEEKLSGVEDARSGLERRSEEKERALRELEEKLSGVENDRSGLERRFEEKEQALRELEEKFSGGEDARSGLETHFKEKEQALRELEERLSGVEDARSGLDRRFEEKERALRELEEKYSGAEDERAVLERLLEERDGFLRKLEGKLEEAESAGSRLEERIREKEEALRGMDRELAGAGDALGLLEAERQKGRGLEETVKGRNDELAELRKKIEDADERHLNVSEERRGLESRLREFEERIREAAADRTRLKEEHNGVLLDAREKIETLRKELKDVRGEAQRAGVVGEEFEKAQQLLRDVVERAQTEVIERTREEVVLRERLKTSIEEKKFFLSRLERELTEAGERERRLSDLLDKALRGSAQLAASLPGAAAVPDNLPVAIPQPAAGSRSLRPAIAAAAAVLLAAGAWFAMRGTQESSPPVDPVSKTSAPPAPGSAADPLASQREVWEQWTRSDVSGGVLLQATLRSPDEIAAEVEAEKTSRGWSRKEAQSELRSLLEPYRFDEHIYFYLYLKNLEPGYPSYIDDIYSQLSLRDDEGNETQAFLPPDLEKYRRVYSFNSGDLAKSREGLIYEVTVPVAFSRSDLAGRPAYIQLLAYNIGSSSRRVLTWEME